MNKKKHYQLHFRESGQRQKEAKNYGRTIARFLKTQQQPLLTGCLLLGAVALLVGIFMQFPPPSMNTAPQGVTVMSYSAFVRQVRARNVMAVVIQGHELHGLLVKPFVGNDTFTIASAQYPSDNAPAEIDAWSDFVSKGYPSQTQTHPVRSSQNAKISLLPHIDPRRFMYTLLPESGDAALMPLLLSNHVVVKTFPVIQLPTWFGSLWKNTLLLLFVLLLLTLLHAGKTTGATGLVHDPATRLGKSHLRSVESSKAKKNPQRIPGKTSGNLEPAVTFADVAGMNEVRAEVEEIVQFLRNPRYFQRLGARIPRGALLVGPPGTGKTLLAKAVAGEAGVPFFTMSASEFVEMYVGLGASRVRNLFKQARESAPCVIFIDELDAVGRKRSMHMMGNDERDQTLNQLLVELDGFDSCKAVIVLAATNRADILDGALLRPGRFDRHIALSLPDRIGREAILGVHTRYTPLHEDVSLEGLSRLTTGMSGADLANLVNEAALLAARRNREQLTNVCFEEALARIQLGAIRPLMMSEADRRIIAFHEGGHALVAYHVPQADTVNHVTILPRGKSLGVTLCTTEEDRYNYSRENLMARIAVGLGGRVAEELSFGPERVTTGAENDFQVVTDLARRMVTRWGMSQQMGVVFADYNSSDMRFNIRRSDSNIIETQAQSLLTDATGRLLFNNRGMRIQRYNSATGISATRNSSTTMATVIDQEVQRILNEGYVLAQAVLSEYYDQLVRLADALMEYEQLGRAQFEALLEEKKAEKRPAQEAFRLVETK